MQLRRKTTLLGFILGTAFLALMLRPSNLAQTAEPPEQKAYFSSLNALLKTEMRDLPCAVLDLDRIDHNIAVVKSRIHSPRKLRIVVKSLPSIDLIRYITEKAGTRRIMVFHAPHVVMLLKELGDLDILMGKPMPASAAREGLIEMPRAARQVQWLDDTPDRMNNYLKVARELGVKLKISAEIDVGLHRGGARNGTELDELLKIIRDNPSSLEFAGLMGYDGHVSHAPWYLYFGQQRAIHKAFEGVIKSYAEFVRDAKAFNPAWFKGQAGEKLTLNGVGSHTYALYENVETPINDFSLGSGMVKPADFSDAGLAAHEPALYVAIPILKKMSTPPIPFLEPLWGLLMAWDPNIQRSFYIYGGVWDAEIVHPRGLMPGWFYDAAIVNLLPNQSLLSGSASVNANVGDYIFIHPREGDGMTVYHDIVAVRGGKAVAHWRPFPLLN